MLPAVIAACGLAAVLGAPAQSREYAFDIWDWTRPCQDVGLFRVWAADLKKAGFTCVEISAPWRVLEPRPARYDFSFVDQRLAVCRELGLALRIRVNSYYAGATPDWMECDRWQDADGKTPMPIPSINDERFWERFGPLTTALSGHLRGRGVEISPFIGVHAELKWSDWWSFDPSSLRAWRDAIRLPRAVWLRRVVGDAALPETPAVPSGTHGRPDLSPGSRALIAFREHSWRRAVERFVRAARAGDPGALVSVPLGESYRSASAQMSNLDYFGLSRGASHVQHSYDFFWHARQEPWHAAASVAAFRGITGVPRVSFEIDGPVLQQQFGYTPELLVEIGRQALSAGAGLKIANYSYDAALPSTRPFLVTLGKDAASAPPNAPVDPSRTVLLFVSKWTAYSYREPTEWLNDAQFGAYRMLTSRGYRVRLICEDNLAEPLSRYRGVYVAFSPPETMPADDRRALERLCKALPAVVEMPATPMPIAAGEPEQASGSAGDVEVACAGLPVGPVDCGAGEMRRGDARLIAVKGRRVTVGYALGYLWLNGWDRQAQDRVLDGVLRRTWGLP